MINIVVDRKWKLSGYTIGKMYVNNASICDTLEDTDRGLLDTMTLDEIKKRKVYGQTAIPRGTYMVKLTYSPKFAYRAWGKRFGGLVPEVQDVKGFSGVRIHPANTADEVLGCIAVGENRRKGKVLSSVKWYNTLMKDYLMPAHRANMLITLTIG